MAIRSRGGSPRIAEDREDHGKIHPEKNGDHFFHKSRRIASQRAVQKEMATTLQVKFELFLASTFFVHA